MKRKVRLHEPLDSAIKFFTNFCAFSPGLKPSICFKTAEAFKDIVIDVVINHHVLPKDFCAALNGEYHKWSIDTRDIKPESYNKTNPMLKSTNVQRILHLTDTHMDPDYLVGSITKCGEPICCHKKIQNGGAHTIYAGIYGDRSCDTPYVVLDSLLEDAIKNYEYELIFFTGDVVPHNDWEQSKNFQLKCLSSTVDRFKKYLSGKPFAISIGNHESFPVDNFNSIDYKQSSWLYEAYANLVRPWLNDQAYNMARKYGFYTMLFKNKVRVISLNTNFCEKMNFWLMVKNKDPFDQLNWMKETLISASVNKEKVYIIGHHPPNSRDCLEDWGANYNKIVSLFPSTVVGQFFGHEHNDYFNIQFNQNLDNFVEMKEFSLSDSSSKNIISIQQPVKPWQIRYAAPSVTTFGYVNPAYRIYLTNDDSDAPEYKRIMDFETYSFDLDDANKIKNADWKLLYRATEFFNVPNVDAVNMLKIISRLNSNFTFYREYRRIQDRLPSKSIKCNYNEWYESICQLLRESASNESYCRTLIDRKKMSCH